MKLVIHVLPKKKDIRMQSKWINLNVVSISYESIKTILQLWISAMRQRGFEIE